jgi:hypothetical protein
MWRGDIKRYYTPNPGLIEAKEKEQQGGGL